MKITARQLEIFIALAQTGKTTLAADVVGISQAAVSMTTSELEQQLERPLFTRERNRLELNDFGRRILPEALRAIHHVRRIESIATDFLALDYLDSSHSHDASDPQTFAGKSF
ncbi:MAG: LysR family transcriptional regulator [Rhodocyclaceae bacterium]|jgi:DNA-binding transcriptional LysR family regulator|nr:LysR family transcriptional regulator [Rhodocyclaceae bacterium]